MKLSATVTSFVMMTLVYVTFASPPLAGEAVLTAGGSGSQFEDYPSGDPRRCENDAVQKGHEIERFEVLPGFGWDNLRNQPEGQVVSFNYSQCRTTDDGRFLLPDSVSAVPVKDSHVQTFAELIDHWMKWTSSTSASINREEDQHFVFVSISGKFSAEFQDVKSGQIEDHSQTTRTQLRYIRYGVQLEPDAQIHPVFRARIMAIAQAVEAGNKDEARYLAQLVVRDFGTHVITKADAGASLELVDQVSDKFMKENEENKSDILASASLSLFCAFHMSASYETKTDQSFAESYKSSRSSSNVVTRGGPVFKPGNYTADMWADEVGSNLVAMDRAGDPLYYVITAAAFPELHPAIVSAVYDQVLEAVVAYYEYNRIAGCTDYQSPLFSPSANLDDGTCTLLSTNFTFGGMYQTCTRMGVCGLANPLTRGYSCPSGYRTVKLHSGNATFCHVYIFWIKCTVESYDLYWCASIENEPLQYQGYLFGGLYTNTINNPVTRKQSCPAHFYSLSVPSPGDLHVCISDEYVRAQNSSLPFAGFFSCDAGNPYAANGGSQGQGVKVGGNSPSHLLALYEAEKNDWPKRCPEGFSDHLATIQEGCQIYYCVQTKALHGEVNPPINRPPFAPVPKVKSDSFIYDPSLKSAPGVNEAVASKVSSSDRTMTPGAAAGITVGAMLGCILIVAAVAVVLKRRRSRPMYRRVETDSLREPAGDSYGSVRYNLSVAQDGASGEH